MFESQFIGFARALSQLPTILADNAGLDSADLVSQVWLDYFWLNRFDWFQLRAAHNGGQHAMGVDLNDGVVADMNVKGVSWLIDWLSD